VTMAHPNEEDLGDGEKAPMTLGYNDTLVLQLQDSKQSLNVFAFDIVVVFT